METDNTQTTVFMSEKDELQRLSALKEYDIMDSAPEASFDDIVEIASQSKLCLV